jgi:hypothetical protein
VQAVQNKAQVWVFAALKELRARLPFPLRGIDSDNVLPARASRLFGDSFPERGDPRYLPSSCYPSFSSVASIY